MGIKILSYANRIIPSVENLIYSLEKYNYDYEILGIGEKWKGFISKIIAYKNACSKEPKNKIIVCCDSMDVLVCGFSNEVSKKLYNHNFQDKLLFGAEILCTNDYNCTPLKKWWSLNNHRFDTYQTQRYCNSGVVIGTAEKQYKLWSWILENNYTDDQKGACEYIETFPNEVDLDVKQEIIANIQIENFHSYYCRNNRIFYHPEKTKPIFIHTPGFDLHFCYNEIVRCLLKKNGKQISLTEHNYVRHYYRSIKKPVIILLIILLLLLLVYKRNIMIYTILIILFFYTYIKLTKICL